MKDDYKSFPTKRMAAGCLFLNEKGEVLLLNPAYKNDMEIPGGKIEENESPKAACERELKEELGISKKMGRLLVVDYNTYPEDAEKTEAIMFIFDGGIMSSEELKDLKLAQDEIIEAKFYPRDKFPDKMYFRLKNRVLMAIEQKENNSTAYLEDQKLV
jgi:8-oxo-dGTP pyrophosphatase MutT (NUDIX family)